MGRPEGGKGVAGRGSAGGKGVGGKVEEPYLASSHEELQCKTTVAALVRITVRVQPQPYP